MKKWSKYLSVALSALLLSSAFAACGGGGGGGGGDISLDDDGNIVRPGGTSGNSAVTEITFWGTGNAFEYSVFNTLVADFNRINEGVIKVNYQYQSYDDYNNRAEVTLDSRNALVDVLYVEEAVFKKFAEYEFLEPLDNYLQTSQSVKIDEMWETSVNRYLYDVETTTQDGPNAHYWGIPKDIGPTVLYYNETFFTQAGVKVISVAAEDLDEFNNGGADSRGQTKASLNLTDTVKEKGYFIDGNGQKWFNNQVPMSWEECVALAKVVQDTIKPSNPNFYGYFTEWWFNYGWSVGGDCIEYVETTDSQYNGGYWDFTLMEDTKNYIVADDNAQGYEINGKTYRAGEIIEWADKLVDTSATNKTVKPEIIQAAQEGLLNELPSQREAFVEFVRIGQEVGEVVDTVGGVDLEGYGISAPPNSLGGDGAAANSFGTGLLGMLVDGRWAVPELRELMDSKYAWDVAPLPMYKEYDANGDITVHGIEAGHSGSTALCINAKSNKKNAAWKFAEYIGGAVGQAKQAESGFAIPSQKAIANSETFLQTNKNPKNSIVFVRAAEHQTPGDWWYLQDKLWTDSWAGVLNSEVRNGECTLSQFETRTEYTSTWETLKSYTKKR